MKEYNINEDWKTAVRIGEAEIREKMKKRCSYFP